MWHVLESARTRAQCTHAREAQLTHATHVRAQAQLALEESQRIPHEGEVGLRDAEEPAQLGVEVELQRDEDRAEEQPRAQALGERVSEYSIVAAQRSAVEYSSTVVQ